MPITHEQAYAEALAVQRTDVVTYYTMEILNPRWTAPVRVVEGLENVIVTLEDDAPDGAGGISPDAGQPVEFVAAPYKANIPTVNPSTEPTIDIEILDPTMRVCREIEEVSPLGHDEITTVVFRPYTSTDLTKRATAPNLEMEVRDIEGDPAEGKVTGKASIGSLLNTSCPYKNYGHEEYPTL